MRRRIDMTGRNCGSWSVIDCAGKSSSGEYYWNCVCLCGSISAVGGKSLRNGHSLECSDCRYKKIAESRFNLKHGKTGSKEYSMFQSAKARAKRAGLRFDLSVEDIVIPEKCPLLGTALDLNSASIAANSPSLDRINPDKGYVKGNVWVVSFRANAIKQNAYVGELETLVNNLKEKILNG